jgi:hypothetical protein
MGPVSVIADVGVGNIFQRGTCCPPAILGGYPSGDSETGVCGAGPGAATPGTA